VQQSTGSDASRKKPYVAPKVMKVDLSPAEVVLAYCKAGAPGPRLVTTCTGCFNLGS
jgi:hypothetical protein